MRASYKSSGNQLPLGTIKPVSFFPSDFCQALLGKLNCGVKGEVIALEC